MTRVALTMLVLALAASVCADIPGFLRQLHHDHAAAYAELRATDYAAFCAAHDLDPDHPDNRTTWHELLFLHDLLTGDGAYDGARGGILRIPYFWHWVDPNPRHAIRSHPDGTPLVDLPPPPGFGRYASRADLDRTPAVYLTDLVTAVPGYEHPRHGTFHTFGWCSEREMAFTALTTALGYRAKVKQEGIHTWSEVWCPLLRTDGDTVVLVACIDNTFDTVHWTAAGATLTVAAWAWDIGAGQTIAWYDRNARALEQLAALREAPVDPAAAARMKALVASYLDAAR